MNPTTILTSPELQDSVTSYSLNSELFFAFHDPETQTINGNPYSFYEVYKIGSNIPLFRRVMNLGTTFMQCEDCRGIVRTREDLQGLPVRVIGVVSYTNYKFTFF